MRADRLLSLLMLLQTHGRMTVKVLAEKLEVSVLHYFFGDRINSKITQAEPPDAQGCIILELSFESLDTARSRLLGFGKAIEVLEPLALRMSIADYARKIVAL